MIAAVRWSSCMVICLLLWYSFTHVMCRLLLFHALQAFILPAIESAYLSVCLSFSQSVCKVLLLGAGIY